MYAPAAWVPLCSGKSDADNKASGKACFVRKLLGPVMDFAGDYDLLQFQFDRHILRQVVSRASIASKVGCDPHLMMSSQWSPEYWRRHHECLLDLVEQVGQPDLFLTIAPYEFFFPYPAWVRKVQKILGRGPTQVPSGEVLAMAHALHQLCAGFLAGKTGGKKWKNHVFSDKTGTEETVQAFFGRFEFQDRGTLHLHILFWLKEPRKVLLEQIIKAELPADDGEVSALAFRVLRGQADEPSRLPLSDVSGWQWDSVRSRWQLRIKHTSEFLEANLRPFLVPLLRILRCHQDIQCDHTSGALLRYVLGYASKFDEAVQNEWWDTASDPWDAAVTMCRLWKPCEAEMVMALARCDMTMSSIDTKSYRPPMPWANDDETLMLYRRRPAECNDLSFLEWLRVTTITTKNGISTATVRKRTTRMCVGLDYMRLPRDAFFYQWLTMNIPHRIFTELRRPEMDKVAGNLQWLCMAMMLAPSKWTNTEWITNYLRQQGHREEQVQCILADLAAKRFAVVEQVAGRMPVWRGVARQRIEIPSLDKQQELVVNKVFDSLVQKRMLHESGEFDALDSLCRSIRPVFLTGGPGSGKSATCLAFRRAGYSKSI